MEWNGNGKGMEYNDIARGMLPLENFDFFVNSTPFHSIPFHGIPLSISKCRPLDRMDGIRKVAFFLENVGEKSHDLSFTCGEVIRTTAAASVSSAVSNI